MKITVEIERVCGQECDEIRSELDEASLYEARYKIVRGWMVGGLPEEAHAACCSKTNDEFDMAVDRLIEAEAR